MSSQKVIVVGWRKNGIFHYSPPIDYPKKILGYLNKEELEKWVRSWSNSSIFERMEIEEIILPKEYLSKYSNGSVMFDKNLRYIDYEG